MNSIQYKPVYALLLLLSGIMATTTKVLAQQHPPRPMAIYTNPAQGLFFGAFFHGMAGGSVILYPDGSRTTTGDVIQASLGYTFSPAIFEVEADAGTRVGILNGANATLTGSNGGTMTMQIGTADVGSSFTVTTTPPNRMQVRIGGTLFVGNGLANPVGSYNGQFSVTFVQE